MSKKVCIEITDEGLALIKTEYMDLEMFIEVGIQHAFSDITDCSSLYKINYELDMEIPKHMPVRMKEKIIRNIVKNVQDEHDGNAPKNIVVEEILKTGITTDQAEYLIDRLKKCGSIFEPKKGFLRIA